MTNGVFIFEQDSQKIGHPAFFDWDFDQELSWLRVYDKKSGNPLLEKTFLFSKDRLTVTPADSGRSTVYQGKTVSEEEEGEEGNSIELEASIKETSKLEKAYDSLITYDYYEVEIKILKSNEVLGVYQAEPFRKFRKQEPIPVPNRRDTEFDPGIKKRFPPFKPGQEPKD